MSWTIFSDSNNCMWREKTLYNKYYCELAKKECTKENCPKKIEEGDDWMETIDTSNWEKEEFITRKLEIKQDISEEEINKMEKKLIDMGIHLASRFNGDDNYFVVGFENKIDLLAFQFACVEAEINEGDV